MKHSYSDSDDNPFHIGRIDNLLDRGCDANIKNKDGLKPLMVYITRIEMVKLLLPYTDMDDQNYLIAATKSSNEIVKLILQNTKDHDAVDSDGRTALMHAIINKNADVTIELSKYNIEIVGNQGKTAIVYLPSVIKTLLDRGMTPIMYAIKHQVYDIFKDCVFDASLCYLWGKSVLMYLINYNYEYDLDINAKSQKDVTALWNAIRADIELLLDTGMTPLQYLSKHFNGRMFDILSEHDNKVIKNTIA